MRGLIFPIPQGADAPLFQGEPVSSRARRQSLAAARNFSLGGGGLSSKSNILRLSFSESISKPCVTL